MGQNNQEYRLEYWATRSSICSHRSLVHSLAHFTHSLAHGTVNYKMAIHSVFLSILAHSAVVAVFFFLGGGRGGGTGEEIAEYSSEISGEETSVDSEAGKRFD